MTRIWWVVPLFFGIWIGAKLRRDRERHGQKPTLRDSLLSGTLTWAVGWASLTTSVADTLRLMHWSDALISLLLLCAIASGPLLLLSAADWLSRAFRPAGVGGKTSIGRDPLD